MEKKLENNSLTKINNAGIFYKIKIFFKNLFKKNKDEVYSVKEQNIKNENKSNEKTIGEKAIFLDNIKKIENEETKLLKLQKQYESGQINSKNLSKKQVQELQKLYEKQIEELSKNIEYREHKLLQYRKKMQII